MKTLSLDVVFKSDCKLRFEAVPLGTTEGNPGECEYHIKRKVYSDDEYLNVVSEFRKVLRVFDKNIVDNGYDEFFHNFIHSVVNSNWNNDFTAKDFKGDDIEVFVKFEVFNDEYKIPYTFYLTEEQKEDIDWIAQGLEDYENMSDKQISEAVMKILLSDYSLWEARQEEIREDWADGIYP